MERFGNVSQDDIQKPKNFTEFTELKKQDGQDYDSLCSMQGWIGRYLRERGYTHLILKSGEFAFSKAVLEEKARVIREDRKGSGPNKSSSLVLSP